MLFSSFFNSAPNSSGTTPQPADTKLNRPVRPPGSLDRVDPTSISGHIIDVNSSDVNPLLLPGSPSYEPDDTFVSVDSTIITSMPTSPERKIGDSLKQMWDNILSIGKFGDSDTSLNFTPNNHSENNDFGDIQINLMQNRNSGVEILESINPVEKRNIFARLNSVKDEVSKIDWEKLSPGQKKLIYGGIGTAGLVGASVFGAAAVAAIPLSAVGLSSTLFGTSIPIVFVKLVAGEVVITSTLGTPIATAVSGMSLLASRWAAKKLFKKPEVQKAVENEQAKQLEEMIDKGILEKVRNQLSSTENNALGDKAILDQIAKSRSENNQNFENIDDFINGISLYVANKLAISDNNGAAAESKTVRNNADTPNPIESVQNLAGRLLDEIEKAKASHPTLSREQLVFGVMGIWMQDISNKSSARTEYDQEIIDKIQSSVDTLNEGVPFDFSDITKYSQSLGWSAEKKLLFVKASEEVLNSLKINGGTTAIPLTPTPNTIANDSEPTLSPLQFAESLDSGDDLSLGNHDQPDVDIDLPTNLAEPIQFKLKLESLDGMSSEDVVEWYVSKNIPLELQEEAKIKLQTAKADLASQGIDFDLLIHSQSIILPEKLQKEIQGDEYKIQFPLLNVTPCEEENQKLPWISQQWISKLIYKEGNKEYVMSGPEILRFVTQKIINELYPSSTKIDRFPSKISPEYNFDGLELSNHSIFAENIINELHDKIDTDDYFTYDHPVIGQELAAANSYLEQQDIFTEYTPLEGDITVTLDSEYSQLATDNKIPISVDSNGNNTVTGAAFQTLIVAQIINALQNEVALVDTSTDSKNLDTPTPLDVSNRNDILSNQLSKMDVSLSYITRVSEMVSRYNETLIWYKNGLSQQQQKSYDYLMKLETQLKESVIWIDGNIEHFVLENPEDLNVNSSTSPQITRSPEFERLLKQYGRYPNNLPEYIEAALTDSNKAGEIATQNYDYLISELQSEPSFVDPSQVDQSSDVTLDTSEPVPRIDSPTSLEDDLNIVPVAERIPGQRWETALGEHKIREAEKLFKMAIADMPRSQILFTINEKVERLSNTLKLGEDQIKRTSGYSDIQKREDRLAVLNPNKARLAKMILLQGEISKAMAENNKPTTRETVVENTISGDLEESDTGRFIAEPVVEKSEAEIIKDTSEKMDADLDAVYSELGLQKKNFYMFVTNSPVFKGLDKDSALYRKATDLESVITDLETIAPYQCRKYNYENGEVLGLSSAYLSRIKKSIDNIENHELVGRRGPGILKQDYNGLNGVLVSIKSELEAIKEDLKNVDIEKQSESIEDLIEYRNIDIDDIRTLRFDEAGYSSLLEQQKAKIDQLLAQEENPILVQNDKSNLDAVIDRLQSYILREANAIASYENDVLRDSPNLEPKELDKHLAKVAERKAKLANTQELLNYVGSKKEDGYTPITPTINVVNTASQNSPQQNLKPEAPAISSNNISIPPAPPLPKSPEQTPRPEATANPTPEIIAPAANVESRENLQTVKINTFSHGVDTTTNKDGKIVSRGFSGNQYKDNTFENGEIPEPIKALLAARAFEPNRSGEIMIHSQGGYTAMSVASNILDEHDRQSPVNKYYVTENSPFGLIQSIKSKILNREYVGFDIESIHNNIRSTVVTETFASEKEGVDESIVEDLIRKYADTPKPIVLTIEEVKSPENAAEISRRIGNGNDIHVAYNIKQIVEKPMNFDVIVMSDDTKLDFIKSYIASQQKSNVSRGPTQTVEPSPAPRSPSQAPVQPNVNSDRATDKKVEARESTAFDPNSYNKAAQNFIDKAFAGGKLEKIKLEKEIRNFTRSNWGYSDRVFTNSSGKYLPQKAMETMLISTSIGNNTFKANSFDAFLTVALDHLSYVQDGSIYRNYVYNSILYFTLARMDKSISKEIVAFCKNYPSEGFDKNKIDRDRFIAGLKSSGRINEFQKAFEDVLASF